MPLTKVGINLSALNNVTQPTFTLKNTSDEFLADIPTKANEVTGGYYGLVVLVGVFIYLWWKLQQSVLEGGDYDYDQFRSMGIAASICSILGLYCLNIGIFVNLYHVIIFIVIAFAGAGIAWKTTT